MGADCLHRPSRMMLSIQLSDGAAFVQAHLKADQYYSVVANMRGTSPEDVATKILSCEALRGLQVTFPNLKHTEHIE